MTEIYDLKGSKIGRAVTEKEREKSTGVIVQKDLDFSAKDRHIYMDAQTANSLVAQLDTDWKWLEEHNIMDYSFMLGVHKIEESDYSTTPRDTIGRKSVLKSKSSSSMKGSSKYKSLKSVPSIVYFIEDAQEDVSKVKSKSKARTLRAHSIPRPIKPSLLELLHKKESVSQFHRMDGGIISSKHPDYPREIYYFGIVDTLQFYNSKKKMAHYAKSLRSKSKDLSTVNPTYYANRFKEFIKKSIYLIDPETHVVTPLLNSLEKDAKGKKKKEEEKPKEESGKEESTKEEKVDKEKEMKKD